MSSPADPFESLARQIGEQLLEHGWLLATAESCTGGWVSAAITAIAGSSQWFERGYVTYSNQAKQEMLGVQASTLEHHGAVSEAAVLEMASGAINHSGAQCAVAISGIAGPGGGSTEKPAGTICFAWALPGSVEAVTQHFSGDRKSVRSQSVHLSLQGLLQRLQAK